jgi:transposase InsO family protein
MIFFRMCWVYFLRQKSEFFLVLRKFQKIVERQSGCLIKKLRSDRGVEYNSKEFEKFYDDIGLERKLTVGYSPEQNCVVERKNKIIVEMVRTMMNENDTFDILDEGNIHNGLLVKSVSNESG